MPTGLVAIIGIAAFIGMIVCAKKKENPKSKPIAGLCLAVLVVCAGMYLHNNGIFTGEDKETRDQRSSYARFEESTAKALGDYITQNFASSKVIIVAAGGTKYAENPSQLSRAEMVKKYIPSAEIKALDYVRAENEMAMMPGATSKEFNDFFKANADASVFILLENLPFDPMDAAKLSIWKAKGKQKIALLNSDVSLLFPYFKMDIVTAAVVSKPGLKEADYEKLAPEDLNQAFGMRYLLITSKNIDQHKTNSRIFRMK
jgi:hypothetical protein